MSGSDKSHSVSNPFGVQGPLEASSLGDWSHESPCEEVSLVEEEGSMVRGKSTEKG